MYILLQMCMYMLVTFIYLFISNVSLPDLVDREFCITLVTHKIISEIISSESDAKYFYIDISFVFGLDADPLN